MKKIVIIGASDFQKPLIIKAKEMGFETHVFAWKCGDEGETIADYFYPISITEKEVIYSVCKMIRPDAITTIGSDLAVITVSYVAGKLGLIANDYKNHLKCTNKYEMRKAFAKKGIAVPKYEKIGNIDELNNCTFPKIVKPTDRSGSRAISLVNNKEELEVAINNAVYYSFEKKAIVEDVIEGDREYSCETVSFKGKHRIIAVTKKFTTGFPSCIETGHLQPSDLSKNEINKLKKLIPMALDSLNVKYGASHTEFKITSNGDIYIIEIGARMGGDCIGSHLVKLSTGYDFVKMTVDIATGKKPDFHKEKNYKYALIKFIFSKEDIKKVNNIVNKYPNILIEKSEIQDMNHKITDSSTRFGYYIFAFNSEEILKYIINEVGLYE